MNELCKTLLVILLVVLPVDVHLYAQQVKEQESLPIGFTEEELTRLDEIGINHKRSDPPTGNIRNCAEWEPSEGVIIKYPLGISVSLVAEMSEDVVVWSIVSSTYYRDQAINYYSSNGVNMDNTDFIIAPTNTWWTRDYGPWFIFNDETMGIVDHIYNRPRPDDDVIPQVIGAQWGMTVYGMDLKHTGGNHMSDGLGMSISTQLVYNENPSLSHDEVDSIMLAYLGNDYTVLGYTESGGIHHIDCWAKFLSPTTIMVKDVPSWHSSYALLNARADFLSQQISPWGEPYTVVRVYCPNDEPYTNSLILNDKVLVPMDGTSWDDDAITTYEEAMPGYEVIGFSGSWYSNDALHCRTMGVPDRDMLFINHVPLHDTNDDQNDRLVSVHIETCSGTALIMDSLKIYYSVDGKPYTYAPLYSTATPDSFYGHIPAQSDGSDVSYFIKAADLSGRVETHPYIGESGAHEYTVLDENSPPVITSPDTLFSRTSDDFAFYPEFTDPDDTAHQITYSLYPGWLSVSGDSLVGVTPEIPETAMFRVVVSDGSLSDSADVDLFVYLCGDANGSDDIDIDDAVYLAIYIFSGGDEPYPSEAGDADCSGVADVDDVVYLIAYIFSGGPAPCADCP